MEHEPDAGKGLDCGWRPEPQKPDEYVRGLSCGLLCGIVGVIIIACFALWVNR